MELMPTILIVDDEKHTRDGLRSLLEDDYDVYVAEDIRGALDVLEREQVDLRDRLRGVLEPHSVHAECLRALDALAPGKLTPPVAVAAKPAN